MSELHEPTLYVVGTPIGNLGDLSPRAVETFRAVQLIACEDTRRTSKLLRHAGVAKTKFVVVNEHTEHDAVGAVLARLAGGESVALVSDAGMPVVSDPGHLLINAVVEAGVRIEVVPGPSAALSALVLSGLVADRFCFEGFVPRKGAERTRRLAAIATESRTTVLFEAPHRLARTLGELRSLIGDDRPVAVARELTKLHEEVWRTTLGEAAVVATMAEPRGEHVVVLAGAPPLPTDDDAIVAELRRALVDGASRRDAIDDVATALAVNRNRVYALAVSLDG
jgi:16S rRNA (cytidine1402-2'-O)-methyltransferase